MFRTRWFLVLKKIYSFWNAHTAVTGTHTVNINQLDVLLRLLWPTQHLACSNRMPTHPHCTVHSSSVYLIHMWCTVMNVFLILTLTKHAWFHLNLKSVLRSVSYVLTANSSLEGNDTEHKWHSLRAKRGLCASHQNRLHDTEYCPLELAKTL